MQFPVNSPLRKWSLLGVAAVLALAYIAAAAREPVATFFANRIELTSLQRAARIDPTSADYFYRLGRYFLLVAQDPATAVKPFREAVFLNPHAARYWFDLANTYQVLGDRDSQTDALEHAIETDPKTPDVAWEAANLFLVRGENDHALREFRVVMESGSYQADAAMQLCWRIQPDVDALLRDVVPNQAGAYVSFISALMAKQQTAETEKVWPALIATHETFDRGFFFEYIKYLIAKKDIDQAQLVWRQGALVFGLQPYVPSTSNLMVNPDFSFDVLNGGFDWQYHKINAITLALDSSEYHAGPRSLSITFHGPGVDDAGIYEAIVVKPGTKYNFTGFYKTAELEGAGGPHFTIQDVYGENILYESDELKDSSFWKSIDGDFTTGPDTKLILFHLRRLPAGNAIRGKLWIDDFRLVQKQE